MNILISGVGGQGVILFSEILANLALAAGLDIKKSEVHGMAQRGGSVTSHIRYGVKVHSPLIEEGTADLLVAFEALEALRYVHFLAPTGRLVYDPHRIDPLPVSTGAVERPTDASLAERIRARVPDARPIPAFARAAELGNPRVQNVVMLGAVAGHLEFPADAYRAAIRTIVKQQAVELNLTAFDAGRAMAEGT
jgi:indolepyruvate ferredoxin oxidoreductase, beta subunit